jgi:hypothetical protein
MHPHQAHTSQVAEHRGADQEKLAALWEFEASSLFSEAERAALRVAHGAGCVPNAVTDEDMAELRRHVTDEHVVELVAVMVNFGFLNRWNDTIITELELCLLRRMALARRFGPYLLGMRCTNEGVRIKPGFSMPWPQRGVRMTPAGNFHGHLWALSRARRQSEKNEGARRVVETSRPQLGDHPGGLSRLPLCSPSV